MDRDKNELDSLNLYMAMPPGTGFEKRCWDEFWSKQQDKLQTIFEKAQPPEKQMPLFVEWLDGIELKYGAQNVRLLGNFTAYDFKWLDIYAKKYGGRPCLYQKIVEKKDGVGTYKFSTYIDTNQQYRGALLILKPDAFEKWGVEESLGIQNDKYTNDHDALTDARNIVLNYLLYLDKYGPKRERDVEGTQEVKKIKTDE